MKSDFDDAYFRSRQKDLGLREIMYDLDCKFLIDSLGKESETLTSFKVLDFGCSDGGFLDRLPVSWQKYGVEINIQQAAIARAKGYTILEETPENVHFDLVIIRGVLHHLPRPSDFFEKLVSVSTVAILANPNPNSFLYLRKGTLPALQVSDDFSSNFFLFSASQLKSELKKLKFVKFRIQYPYFRTPYRKIRRDFIVLLRLILGLEIKELVPLPGNMFNLIATKDSR